MAMAPDPSYIPLRRHGCPWKPKFYQFHFNHGVTDYGIAHQIKKAPFLIKFLLMTALEVCYGKCLSPAGYRS
jgi:hypothetical protein